MNKSLRDWLIIMNLIGFFIGIVFSYSSQLLNTNPLLWIFVPDCPLAALLFAASLILLAFNKKSDTLFLLSFISGIKYGLWTVLTISSYWSFYVSYSSLVDQVINIISHVVLIIEQFFLLKIIKLDYKKVLFIFIFLLVQDLSDYLLDTHPPMPDYAVQSMFYFTIMLTLFSTALVYYLIKNREFISLKLLLKKLNMS